MIADTTQEEAHLGNNVRKLRSVLGLSQSDLADKMKMPASQLCKLEQQRHIDDEMLDKIAEAMGVSVDTIKNYNHEATINFIISNNTFSGEDNKIAFGTSSHNDHRTINPLEKVSELYEQIIKEKEQNIRNEYLIAELQRKLDFHENK